MKIKEYNKFTGKSYRITISTYEDLDALEIAECFKHQYPKERATILFPKIKEIQLEIILIDPNLNKLLKK